jgi:hypothetical protein
MPDNLRRLLVTLVVLRTPIEGVIKPPYAGRNIMGLVYYLYTGEAKMNEVRLIKTQSSRLPERSAPSPQQSCHCGRLLRMSM